MAESLLESHETLSAVLSAGGQGLRRWQRALVVCALFIGMLTVDCWLWWNRASLCCAEMRDVLGCGADPAQPCRGFTGDCGQLQDQFGKVPGSGLDTYSCTQFPTQTIPLHKFLVICLMIGAFCGVILYLRAVDRRRGPFTRRGWRLR